MLELVQANGDASDDAGVVCPSRAMAEEAVRTLIRWAGDDPARPGLRDTPSRVVRAYEEWFSGYRESPESALARTFDDVADYQDLIMLRDIPVLSTCEHHLAAIGGVAHIAYFPTTRVVGISKLARTVATFSRRLQIQERLTAEIASSLQEHLQPRGVAVIVDATHECMSSRGVRVHGSRLRTQAFLGMFARGRWRSEVLQAIGPA